MIKEYEAVVVFDSDVDESGVKAQIERFSQVVATHSGEVTKHHVWGRRALAYPIRKKQYGIYTLLNFTGDNTLVSDLRRQLRINELVLRSLIVEKDKFAPDYDPKSRYDIPLVGIQDEDFGVRDSDEEVMQ